MAARVLCITKYLKNTFFSDGSNSAFPLKGLIFDEDGFIKDSSYFWTANGFCNHESYHPHDIIGMWDEPKISIEDLPKPFKPKDGEPFYYIYWGEIYCDYGYSERSSTYRSFSQNGQCFRTKEDAQKWLDFMKSMVE